MFSPIEEESSYQYIVVTPEMSLREVTKYMHLAANDTDRYAIVQSHGEAIGCFYAKTLVQAVAEGRCLESTLVSEVMISLPQTNAVTTLSSNFPKELVRIMQDLFHEQYIVNKHEALISTIASCLKDFHNSKQLNILQEELENCLQKVTQLQEQAVLYQCIVEMAGEGIWVIDSNATISFVNPRMAEILEYHTQEMLRQSLFSFMDREEQTICARMLERCAQGLQEHHEFKFRSKKGTDVWAMVAATPIVGADGQCQGVLAMVTDISDRKQNEAFLEESNQLLEIQIQQRTQSLLESQQELKAKEEFLRTIYEGSDAPIFVIDIEQDGTMHQRGLNPKAEVFMGVELEQVIGKSLEQIFGPEQGAAIHQLFSRCIETKSSITYEERREFQGQTYWWSTTLTPLQDNMGRVYRLIGNPLDITARKEAEILQQKHLLELAEWQNRYETAGEASGQVLYEYDIQADRPIWGANAEKILGYPTAKMLDSVATWVALIHPEDREEFRAQWELLLHHKKPLRIEYRFFHSDGFYIWLEDKNRFLANPEGESHRIVGFISDISDKKEAQLQLQQINTQLGLKNEELAHAMQMKDEFLASMSHELRTPLNAILGNSEILLEEILGSITERQRKAVSSIERSGQHLLSLINDVLDLAKIGSGQIDLQLAPIPIQALCNSCIEFVQPLAEKKQIQLNAHLSTPDLAMLQGDERRLRQVLINLLSNAIKFTPNGGNVTLEVQPDEQLKIIQFSVKDTGVGIAPENLKKLFQSFVQVDSSLNRRYEGTGLGLAIVKKIMELHDGTVSVESTIDQGSCFTVSFPWS
jgi:PAS domain S-box-containing protein